MQQHTFDTSSSQPYVITEYDHFLTPEECDQLIELARPRLVESKVYESAADTLDRSIRVSMQCWIHDTERVPLVEQLNRKIERIVNIPSSAYESLQIVRYQEGGFYRPHYDACNDTPEKCQRMNDKFGSQRYITFLIYLNDDFEGGGTHFPKLPFTTRPRKGTAIMFFNTDPKGMIVESALHGGEPIQKGEKWICNRWIHYPTIQENYRPLVDSSTKRLRFLLFLGGLGFLMGLAWFVLKSKRIQKA